MIMGNEEKIVFEAWRFPVILAYPDSFGAKESRPGPGGYDEISNDLTREAGLLRVASQQVRTSVHEILVRVCENMDHLPLCDPGINNMFCTTVGRTTRGQGVRLGRGGCELCHSELGGDVNDELMGGMATECLDTRGGGNEFRCPGQTIPQVYPDHVSSPQVLVSDTHEDHTGGAPGGTAGSKSADGGSAGAPDAAPNKLKRSSTLGAALAVRRKSMAIRKSPKPVRLQERADPSSYELWQLLAKEGSMYERFTLKPGGRGDPM